MLNLPFGVEVATVVRLGVVVLLQLSIVLVELLVIYIGLDLIYYLLGSRSWSILRLRQLLHCCWVDVVDLSTRTYNCTSLILLCIHNGLSLGLCLRLSNLQVESFDLVHQGCYILIVAISRNNLGTDLLQSVSGNVRLQNWGLTYYLGGSMRMVQLCYISRQLSISSLSGALVLSNSGLSILRILTALHVATQLLGAQAEQVCVLSAHVRGTV